jgi:hypothetical protein
MAGDGPSDPFEYLLDPIDGDATTTDTPVATSEVAEPSPRRRRRSLLLLAGATVTGALVGLILVLLWPERVEAVTTPEVPATRPPAPPVTTSQSVELTTAEPAPPPAPEPEPTPSVPVESPPAAPPPEQAPPSPPPSEPVPRPAPSPTLRTPISVSPEPRPAFPNQPGGDGKPPDGGLLPGLGLPGPL